MPRRLRRRRPELPGSGGRETASRGAVPVLPGLYECPPALRGGLRVLEGRPARQEANWAACNVTPCTQEEQDATLLFTCCTAWPALEPRRARGDAAARRHQPSPLGGRARFASLLEHDLLARGMPPAEDRHFLMQHLLERRGQAPRRPAFLAFLKTLHPLDEERTRTVFLPSWGGWASSRATRATPLAAHRARRGLAHEYRCEI
jgi:hypothetical protein